MTTITQPSSIEITELSAIAFGRAAVLINQGYVFSQYNAPQTFANGYASITLVLAKHDADSIAGAAQSFAEAVSRETVVSEREAAAALAATEAEQKRQAAKAEIEAKLSEAKNAVRRLEAAAKKA